MVRSLDRAKLWAFMEPLLRSPLHSIRPELMEFAQQRRGALSVTRCGRGALTATGITTYYK
jgi:hypothetical protein